MDIDNSIINLKTVLCDLNLRQYSDRKLIQMIKDTGVFMYSDIMAISSLLDKDSVVVDVGANVGGFTCGIAKFVGKVYSIDPSSKTLEMLNSNLKINNLINVSVIHSGAGDVNSEMKIVHTDISSSTHFSTEGEGAGEFVKVCKVDDLINDKVDFIKIDAEGMDFQVILGAWEKIKKFKTGLFVEYRAHDWKNDFKELLQYRRLLSKDYYFYLNLKNAINTKEDFYFGKLPSILTMFFSTGTQDFYAINKSKEVKHINPIFTILILLLKKIKTKLEILAIK
jgi:FkbM family methyltransferase